MKLIYKMLISTILLFTMAVFCHAQNPIPNAGFEDWTEGTPDHWQTLDIPGLFDAVTQSENARSGMSAAKGEVVDFFGAGAPPYLVSDTAAFPISENYEFLKGYYQFVNNGEDVFFALVQFYDTEDSLVASGQAEFGETSEGYTEFEVVMNYDIGISETAEQAIIAFSITPSSESQSDSVQIGSYFLLDDLEFGSTPNAIDDFTGNRLESYSLNQNYPNPFNPSTTIEFTLPISGRIQLSVFNSIGQEVELLINDDLTAGEHQITFNADHLPSGVYFYKLQADQYVNVKKMILLK
jgi:hypothetical protein